MPPTSTPAILTPLAIRSSRDESYANAATAPPTRTRRRTATKMNHRCLMGGIPAQGTSGSGDRRLLTARLRLAAGQKGLDRVDHARAVGGIAPGLDERLEGRAPPRSPQRDHPFPGE